MSLGWKYLICWFFIPGDYFCRISNPKAFDTKKGNMDDCHKEYFDSTICNVKVVLPTKDQLINGDIKFSNEEIRILEQPDINMSSEVSSDSKSSPSQTTRSRNSNRRAAIGDKVGIKSLQHFKKFHFSW